MIRYRHVRCHRAEDRADREQDQRNRNHDAAAIDVAQRAEHRRHRSRGQQIGRDDPGQVADVVELAADGRQRRRHDGLVERGQEHRQQQAHQDGANLVGAQRRRRRNRRRIADIDDLGRDARQLAADIVRQCRLVGRLAVLPLVLVHVRCNIVLRGRSGRDEIAISHCTLEGKFPSRQDACAHGCIPRGYHRVPQSVGASCSGTGYLLSGGQFKANGHSVGIDASVYFGR